MEKTYYVYAIRSTVRSYIYVGLTDDIERRFIEHNKGYNKTTKPYAPFVLIYSETAPNRVEARLREKYLKSSIGKSFLKSFLPKG
jgi:putative endonuclease